MLCRFFNYINMLKITKLHIRHKVEVEQVEMPPIQQKQDAGTSPYKSPGGLLFRPGFDHYELEDEDDLDKEAPEEEQVPGVTLPV